MSNQPRKLRVPGELEQMRPACDFVADVARDAGLSADDIFHCQLCIEEIFTNIVEHGYEYNSQGRSIEIVCEQNPKGLLISIIDEAPRFNPLKVDNPDPTAPLSERDGGGWGVYFVKNLMDDIRYEFQNGRNHLILKKHTA